MEKDNRKSRVQCKADNREKKPLWQKTHFPLELKIGLLAFLLIKWQHCCCCCRRRRRRRRRRHHPIGSDLFVRLQLHLLPFFVSLFLAGGVRFLNYILRPV